MKIPYGYYFNENNEVLIDNEKSEAVILIYDMYIDNFSLRKISDELSSRVFCHRVEKRRGQLRQ